VEIHDPSRWTIQRGKAARIRVSQEFLDSLLRESDTELIIKRAQAAGLIVEAMGLGSGGKFIRVVDPATGSIVLTSSTMP